MTSCSSASFRMNCWEANQADLPRWRHVSEKGNEVLRKCLTPDRSFSTAAEFYDALRGVATAKPEPVTMCDQASQNRSD